MLETNFRLLGNAIRWCRHTEIADDTLKRAVERPSSFLYSGGQEGMFDTWSLGEVIRHRDSDLLAQSNADALLKMLEEDFPELSDDWHISGCNHWAVGWVEHLSFRALNEDGTPTPIFYVIQAWFDSLADYCVADEEDYSRREYEATVENYTFEGYNGDLKDDAPETWAYDVYGWFSDNDRYDCIENMDGQGGWASKEQITEALEALGYLVDRSLCTECGSRETDPDGCCEICDQCSLCCECGTFPSEG